MSKMFSISEYLLYLVYLAYKNCVLKAFHHRRVLTIWYVCKYFVFTSVMPEIVYLGTVTTRRWRPHSALLHSQVGERLHTYTLCTLLRSSQIISQQARSSLLHESFNTFYKLGDDGNRPDPSDPDPVNTDTDSGTQNRILYFPKFSLLFLLFVFFRKKNHTEKQKQSIHFPVARNSKYQYFFPASFLSKQS